MFYAPKKIQVAVEIIQEAPITGGKDTGGSSIFTLSIVCASNKTSEKLFAKASEEINRVKTDGIAITGIFLKTRADYTDNIIGNYCIKGSGALLCFKIQYAFTLLEISIIIDSRSFSK